MLLHVACDGARIAVFRYILRSGPVRKKQSVGLEHTAARPGDVRDGLNTDTLAVSKLPPSL